MSGISPDKFKELAQLQGILTTYAPNIVLPIPDGVLSFSYRMVMGLLRNCLTKYNQGRISSEYLEHLQKNIKSLVQLVEERSQCGDLAFFKQLAQEVLCVLEYPARSLEHLETPDGDSKGESLNVADTDISQPGLKSDLIKETTEPANADDGVCETPEIHKSAIAVTRSLEPVINPRKHDYDLIKVINTGSFGKVQLVRHKDTNQEFAMKTLARRNLHDPELVQLTYLERDIAIFADCPFVISMFCSFPTKRHLCMVMEFAAGGDCASLVQLGLPISLAKARKYIAETILGVEYLHSIGVVHRDLKPRNLMITSTGHIKITDFGLSKIGLMRPTSEIYKAPTEDITREFLDNEMFGSVCYMAPEVLLQRGYGRPVDWWSIGIILYEFLTGSVPFQGQSKNIIRKRILNDDITWEFPNSAPPPKAQDIIIELLRKNPAHRLGTGGANEIKMHPFLSDLNFDKILRRQRYLKSEPDSGLCKHCSDRHKNLHSEMKDTSEINRWPESRNFVSSSHRLSKLYTTKIRMMNHGNGKSCPDYSLKPSTKRSDVQKELSLPTSSVEKRRNPALKMKKEQKTEIVEREPRRGSTFRRMISSVRRGLSRAARTIRESSLFSVYHRGALDLTRTKHHKI